MNQIILHLGSNEGDRMAMLKKALALIDQRIGKISVMSSVYETEAWGLKDQDDFLNQALIVKSSQSAIDVLKMCKSIEMELGGEKKIKWGPRSIDIDLLFYNDEVLDTELLKLPHPMVEKRNFVLIPLMEIAGDYIHPINGKTIDELYEESDDTCEVFIFEDNH